MLTAYLNVCLRAMVADNLTKQARSKLMRSVRTSDTGAEVQVRRIIHSLGLRYGLHAANLPGKPDIVFRSRRKVIFVNGCFWHGHNNCNRGSLPSTNRSFWSAKITKNRERDKSVRKMLHNMGWNYRTIWECQIRNGSYVRSIVKKFVEDKS